MNATYYVSDIAVFQKTEGGVRALWDDEGNYTWGEFIDAKDFNADAFSEVSYVETDFTNTNPFYQRQMTQEAAQEASNE